jgi:thiamine-phosphate pyrophosphorylase
MPEAQHKTRTQLYLVTPPVTEAESIIQELGAAFTAGEIACVLLDPGAADEHAAKKTIRAIGALVQPKGSAFLVSGSASLAARAGADGVHLSSPGPALAEALDSLKPERIVGVSGLRSRHDAMTVAETGIDYVMFGEPHRDGSFPSLDSVLERTEWWAELFEIPCVAYAPDFDSIGLLAAAGADFVALGPQIWLDKGETGPILASALRVLEEQA